MTLQQIKEAQEACCKNGVVQTCYRYKYQMLVQMEQDIIKKEPAK